MSATAVLLILGAAVAHATWNFYLKRAGESGPVFIWLYTATAVLLYAPLAVLTPVLTETRPSWRWLLAGGVSAVLHVAYFVLLLRGYTVGDLSVVYPLARGTGPLLSVAAAVLLLGERPGVLGLLGAAAVIAGVFVIGMPGGSSGPHRMIGALFGVATGAAIASYTLWDAHAVTTLAVPPLVLSWGTAVGETLVLTPFALADRPRVTKLWRTYRREVLAVAVLSPLAYVLVLIAMRLAPVSLVAPARELSIVIGSLAAWRLLGEPHPLRRMSGAVVVLIGVVLLATS
jgi:drug/metabolite transporter (DMT)-like permease